MPDHIHAILAFPRDKQMSEVLRNWRSYVARNLKLRWQRGYFDHRIRNGENWRTKAEYIRKNPIRQGLISDGTPWPYVLEY